LRLQCGPLRTRTVSEPSLKVLVYRGVDTAAIPGYAKLAGCLESGDFYQRLGESWATRRRLVSALDFADVLAHFPSP
jgi:hypothetical protein